MIKDDKILARLPTFEPNMKKQIVLDANWWGENESRLAPRWSQLMAG